MKPRWLLGGLAAVLYALLAHALMLHATAAPWAVAVLLGPLLVPVLGLAWRGQQAWRGHQRAQRLGKAAWRPALVAGLGIALVMVLLAGAVAALASAGLGDVQRLYLAQHLGVHLVLGGGFAASLRSGHTPLVTRMAGRLHPITPPLAVYTRRVTWSWVGYFFGMAGLSVAVYAALPWSAWSLLANVLTPLLIAGLFFGEYVLRCRLHPEFDRVTLADMLRAVRQPDAGSAAPTAPAVAPHGPERLLPE